MKPLWLGSLCGTALIAVMLFTSYFLFLPSLLLEKTLADPLSQYQVDKDRLAYTLMMRQAAKTRSMLLLGTSEAGGYVYLTHREMKGKVAAVAGAYRTAYTWLDWACHVADPKEYPPEIYYVINPIYFRDWLNNDEYPGLSRYIGQEQVEGLVDCLSTIPLKYTTQAERDELLQFFRTSHFKRQGLLLEKRAYAAAKALYTRLYAIFPFLAAFDPDDIHGTPEWELRPEWYNKIDDKLNVAHFNVRHEEIHNKVRSHKTIIEDYSPRFVELRFLLDVIHHKQMPMTFVLAPYNQPYFAIMRPVAVGKFEALQEQLNALLCKGADCIDLSAYSKERGLFVDYAHFSYAGATLIKDKIIERHKMREIGAGAPARP